MDLKILRDKIVFIQYVHVRFLVQNPKLKPLTQLFGTKRNEEYPSLHNTKKKTNKNPSSNTNSNHFSSPTMAPKPSRNSLSPKAPSFLSQTQTHKKIHPFYIQLKLQTQQAPQPPKSQKQSQNIESSFLSIIEPKNQAKVPPFCHFPTTTTHNSSSDKNNHNKHIQQQPTRIKETERQREKGEAVSKGKASSEMESSSKQKDKMGTIYFLVHFHAMLLLLEYMLTCLQQLKCTYEHQTHGNIYSCSHTQ